MGARIQVYDYAALRTALTSSSNKAAPPSLPAPLIDVPVPAGAQKCLLVVRTDTPGLKSQVFDESAQQFPGGSRLFINLTPYKLEGSCGVTGFEVAPQSSALVSPAVPADHRAIVKIFAQMPSRKAIVVDNTWAFFPNARGIVLIFEVPGGALRTLGLSDEIPPEIGRTAKGI
jgi:hypothetical protein